MHLELESKHEMIHSLMHCENARPHLPCVTGLAANLAAMSHITHIIAYLASTLAKAEYAQAVFSIFHLWPTSPK